MNSNQDRRALLKTILLLAGPTMLEHLLETAVSYIDSAMVGKIGAKATAAIGCTQTINWLIGSAIFAIGIGFLSYISHELGAERPEKARQATAQVSLFVLLIGGLIMGLILPLSNAIPKWMNASPDIVKDASRYFFIVYLPAIPRAATTLYGTCLRAVGDTKTPLKVTFSVNLINILLNFLLIYPTRQLILFDRCVTIPGAGLGVIGAAIASAISFTFGGIGMAYAVWHHSIISPRHVSMKPDPEILKPVFKISIPCILQRIVTSAGYVAFASMVNEIGTIATAAHAIANTAESAFYIPGYGMQTAASTLSGNCWGEGNQERLRHTSRMLICIEVVLMTLTGGILFMVAPSLMQIFTKDAQVILLGSRVLRMVAVSEPIFGVTVILNGVFQGVGDTRIVFVFDAMCMWGIRILGSYIFVHVLGQGLTAAWGCMIAHNACLGVLLTARFISGKWDPIATGRKMH